MRLRFVKRATILMFFFIAYGCTEHVRSQNKIMESPLSSVIKLISAESFGNLEEGEKYIDLEQVYSKHFNDSLDFRTIWKQQIEFKTSLNGTSKFTGHFKYFQYLIKETIDNERATVSFILKNDKAKFKEIKYTLATYGENWRVIQIDYIE